MSISPQKDDHATPEARAERLKEVRQIARLSLKQMTDDGTINYNTLCGWETAKHGGLTEKGAMKVIKKLEQEGFRCSLDWLLYGIGAKPESLIKTIQPKRYESPEIFINDTANLLKDAYPELIGIEVTDDAMSPLLEKGDYILGLPRPIENLKQHNQETIIAILSKQSCLPRTVIYDHANNNFHLQALNLKHPSPIIYNADISSWAIIVCHIKRPKLEQVI